jgi:DNA-binding NarL/FixJ family response regulator
MADAEGGVLVVGNDEGIEAAIVRLSTRTEIRITRSGAAAHESLRAGVWRGLIVDASLPDGSGLDWLESARGAGVSAPALVTTAGCERAIVNRAFRLGARMLCKPCDPEDVVAFVDRLRSSVGQPADLLTAVRELVVRHGLTRREAELLEASVRGTSRQAFVASRGISINTYKTQVRAALRKIGACSLGDVRDQVLRSVLPPPPPSADPAES